MAHIINKILNKIGLEIRRKTVSTARRATMRSSIEQAVNNGLNPQTVIDVGVAQGTPELYDIFPRARHILIEPLEEFTPDLKRIVSGLFNAEYIIAAACGKTGNKIINIHPDLVGSSIYKEDEDSDVNGIERTVPAVTLDGIAMQKKTFGPYLVKVDTQGSELEVLKGAEEVLKDTDFVILESVLFEFFKGGPLFYDIVAFMKNKGFITYDIFDPGYRPLDGAMSQANLAFVKEKSPFRKFHFYATRKQRDEQNKHLR